MHDYDARLSGSLREFRTSVSGDWRSIKRRGRLIRQELHNHSLMLDCWRSRAFDLGQGCRQGTQAQAAALVDAVIVRIIRAMGGTICLRRRAGRSRHRSNARLRNITFGMKMMSASGLDRMKMSSIRMVVFFDKTGGGTPSADSERQSRRYDANDIENREQPSCSRAKRSGHKRQYQGDVSAKLFPTSLHCNTCPKLKLMPSGRIDHAEFYLDIAERFNDPGSSVISHHFSPL